MQKLLNNKVRRKDFKVRPSYTIKGPGTDVGPDLITNMRSRADQKMLILLANRFLLLIPGKFFYPKLFIRLHLKQISIFDISRLLFRVQFGRI